MIDINFLKLFFEGFSFTEGFSYLKLFSNLQNKDNFRFVE